MPRQIRRDQREMGGENGRQIAPTMRGRRRTMQQQQARPLPHALYMPMKPAGFDKLARIAIGPIAAIFFPDRKFSGSGHGIRGPKLARAPLGVRWLTCAPHRQKAAAHSARPWQRRGLVKKVAAVAPYQSAAQQCQKP